MSTPRFRTRYSDPEANDGWYQKALWQKYARKWYYYTKYTNPSGYIDSYETCADSTQPPPFTEDQNLGLTKSQERMPVFNGEVKYWEGSNYRKLTCQNTQRYSGGYNYAGSLIPIEYDSSYWKTKALANLNPNRPEVDIPLFVFELKDIPRLYQQAVGLKNGGVKPSSAPDAVVAYHFGVKPLVNDVMKLLDFAKSMENRKKFLLNSARGFKVARKLTSQTENRGVTDHGASPVSQHFRYKRNHTATMEVWYTAKLKLDQGLDQVDLSPISLFANTYGLTPSIETLWNALPWSWLIDYFANIGDIIAANRGFIKYTATDLCVMCKRTVNRDAHSGYRTGSYESNTISMTNGIRRRILKNRDCFSNPTPTLAFRTLLTPVQIQILGSLLLSKGLKSGGLDRF